MKKQARIVLWLGTEEGAWMCGVREGRLFVEGERWEDRNALAVARAPPLLMALSLLLIAESYTSKNSEDDDSTKESKRLIRKRRRSTDDYSEEEGEDEEDEERPVRKRLNRIETDDEDTGENAANAAAENPAPASKLPAPQAPQDNAKKHCYRIESDEEDDFENVGKVESPLDYSLVDLPSTNGQSPGKTIENLIGKPGEKTQAPKDSTASASLAPNGTGSGQEAVGPEEDEDELLRVTDLVDYVCNSEQL